MDHVREPAGVQSFAHEQAARAPAVQRALQGYSICEPQEDTFAAECMSFGSSNRPKTARACSSSCSLIEVHGWHDGNPKETRRQAEERDLLTDVIQNPSSGGIFVKAVVCDQGASNCTLARRLGVTPDHPFFLVGDTQPATMPEPLPAIKTDEFDLPDE
ncbi:hypothetical protein HPB47_001509 [Ixodes persulcatus]|uniref:Uncharacterized protein n=1 Tax=Ixodes persulcatus TaxID=34615 RepID=A0AC60PNU3_IXOPE|nr:hypothetical protein HPB47_001509 [Ixodes persulcatus]